MFQDFGIHCTAAPVLYELAVSINWRLLCLGVLEIRALLFGAHIQAPDFWKWPTSNAEAPKACGAFGARVAELRALAYRIQSSESSITMREWKRADRKQRVL